MRKAGGSEKNPMSLDNAGHCNGSPLGYRRWLLGTKFPNIRYICQFGVDRSDLEIQDP